MVAFYVLDYHHERNMSKPLFSLIYNVVMKFYGLKFQFLLMDFFLVSPMDSCLKKPWKHFRITHYHKKPNDMIPKF